MKPLIVLLAAFGLSLLANRLISGYYEPALSGRVALSLMLLFTAIAHFKFTKGMIRMIPPGIPFKEQLVYATGFLEIIAAIGILLPTVRQITGWLLISFFLFLLPANIYASRKHIHYEKGNCDGPGLRYLWFRIPLQLFFILWVFLCAVSF